MPPVSSFTCSSSEVGHCSYPHGHCAELGRHHTAKGALGVGKHHPAEHQSILQCECAQAEAAANIFSLAL